MRTTPTPTPTGKKSPPRRPYEGLDGIPRLPQHRRGYTAQQAAVDPHRYVTREATQNLRTTPKKRKETPGMKLPPRDIDSLQHSLRTVRRLMEEREKEIRREKFGPTPVYIHTKKDPIYQRLAAKEKTIFDTLMDMRMSRNVPPPKREIEPIAGLVKRTRDSFLRYKKSWPEMKDTERIVAVERAQKRINQLYQSTPTLVPGESKSRKLKMKEFPDARIRYMQGLLREFRNETEAAENRLKLSKQLNRPVSEWVQLEKKLIEWEKQQSVVVGILSAWKHGGAVPTLIPEVYTPPELKTALIGDGSVMPVTTYRSLLKERARRKAYRKRKGTTSRGRDKKERRKAKRKELERQLALIRLRGGKPPEWYSGRGSVFSPAERRRVSTKISERRRGEGVRAYDTPIGPQRPREARATQTIPERKGPRIPLLPPIPVGRKGNPSVPFPGGSVVEGLRNRPTPGFPPGRAVRELVLAEHIANRDATHIAKLIQERDQIQRELESTMGEMSELAQRRRIARAIERARRKRFEKRKRENTAQEAFREARRREDVNRGSNNGPRRLLPKNPNYPTEVAEPARPEKKKPWYRRVANFLGWINEK
ncbi:MAG: hypothetical protein Q8P05_05750 [Candidatus Diapherotrites archaeon]|nr:hypothetical protein [Candidatus Diapherotrites archaeon]